MNAVAAAIYAKLTADATLTAMLASATAVYEAKAPERAPMPYLVFSAVDPDRPQYTMGDGRSHVKELYVIKAVYKCDADSVDAKSAQAIDERVDALIGTNGVLSISGRTQILCHRQRGMPPYEETKSDRVVLHRGGIYEIWSA